MMPKAPRKPKFPAKVTPESWASYKANLRKYDADRITAGATPSQIQAGNSFFGSPKDIRFLGKCARLPAAVERLMRAQGAKGCEPITGQHSQG